MQHHFPKVDKSTFKASRMETHGNADFHYWFDKTIEQRLEAAAFMIAVAFNEPGFIHLKVDRTVFSARKHNLI